MSGNTIRLTLTCRSRAKPEAALVSEATPASAAPPETDELHLASRREVADFPGESHLPANGWAVVNHESPEAAELDGIAVLA